MPDQLVAKSESLIAPTEGVQQKIAKEIAKTGAEKRTFMSRILGIFSRSKPSTGKKTAIVEEKKVPIPQSLAVSGCVDEEETEELGAEPSAEEPPTDDDSAEIELSLCAHLIYSHNDKDEIARAFLENKVSYEEYSADPVAVLHNPNLLIRFDNKLFEWKSAAPLMVALLAYKRPLPNRVVMQLLTPPGKKRVAPAGIKKTSLSPTLQPEKLPLLAKSEPRSNPETPKTKPMETLHVMIDEFNLNESQTIESKGKLEVDFPRTNVPTSDQLKELHLNEGVNDIEFVVTSRFQGKQSVKARVFLWDWKSKIVISDIDGTITKSDALGQLCPLFGKDWSHPGVAALYQSVALNGYRLLYLSSRAIGLADLTRSYLDELLQNGVGLPKGPLIVSPDRLVQSFKREVIAQKPQVYPPDQTE